MYSIEINKDNLNSFLEKKEFYDITIGDNYKDFEKYLNEDEYLQLKEKDFYLIKLSNVEFTFLKNNKLNTIHFEINQGIDNGLYCFSITDYNDILELIENSGLKILQISFESITLNNQINYFFLIKS